MAEPRQNRTALVAGLFFMVAGVAFLLERLEVWDIELRTLGPALLIAVGLAVVLSGRPGRS